MTVTKKVDTTGDDGDEEVDVIGDDGDKEVDATDDDGDEQVDATGNDGDKEVDITGDDGEEQVDAATGDDGDKQVDAIGDDDDEEVDATNNVDNRFVCTSVNYRGPCGWKIAHECIGEDNDIPIQCKGNLKESCLCLVHPECMLLWLWERSSSAITPVDALSQFNLVCPMHHPHYKKPYMSDMPYLGQRNHPSPMNRQTFTQPPTSMETAKPNEKSSSSGQSSDSSSSDSSTSSSNSNSDCSQSNKFKTSGIAEFLPENKNSSPMIKGMDIMASESAKFAFDRDKLKYSSSEHVERFRQIMISRRRLIVLIVGIVAPLPILVRVVVRPRLLLARTLQTKLQWQLLLMIKETKEMKATAAKKAMRMMMTKRMVTTAMRIPPTM
jgi:hypothetical protein